MTFQQFIQRHRHFLRKCAALFLFLKCGNQSFLHAHGFSTDTDYTFVMSLVTFSKITQLSIQQLMKLTNNQFDDIHKTNFWFQLKYRKKQKRVKKTYKEMEVVKIRNNSYKRRHMDESMNMSQRICTSRCVVALFMQIC